MRSWIVLVLLCAGCASAPANKPDGNLLIAPKDRITDEAIQTDQQTFARTEERIHAINEGGARRVDDYWLSKAQCWLDVSFHEYSRNDRSPFPEAALGQSVRLIKSMEARQTPPDDTPLVNDAARLRPDLWDRAASIRQGRGARCAAQAIACAEVELVHAGNEYNQQGWRHAKPYVQIAEDLVAQASAAADSCPGDAPVPAVAPAPAPPRLQAANILFAFDRYDAASITRETRAELDRLIATVRDSRVVNVRLVGNADRLNSTGNSHYNDVLARRRAETVATVLVEAGFDRSVFKIDSRGDDEPVVDCKGPFAKVELQQACLLANRRVRVEITYAAR